MGLLNGDDSDNNDDNDNDDDEDEKGVKAAELSDVKGADNNECHSAIGGLLLALKDNRPEVSLRAAFRLSHLSPCKVRSEIKKILPECTEF